MSMRILLKQNKYIIQYIFIRQLVLVVSEEVIAISLHVT